MTTASRGGVRGPTDGGRPARSGRSPDPARPASSGLTREVLDGLSEAVVVVDRAGLVTLVNAMATALLPEAAPTTDLTTCAVPAVARAVGSGAASFDAEHGGRRLRGVRRDLADGRHAWYVRDVTEEHARVEALQVERSRTVFLAEAGSRLGLSLQREQTLRTTTTLPVPYLADLAVVVHLPPPPAQGQPHWVRYDGRDPAPTSGLATWSLTGSLPGLAEALAGHPVGPSPWPDGAAVDLTTVLPPDFGSPGTVLVSPMRGAGRTTGALVLVRRAGRAGFARRDVELAREFAARAGAALDAAELYGEQVHLARVLQNSLLPPGLPAVPGAALAGGYRAAGDRLRIGGDFYDVFPVPAGAIFALGDVAGKGVGAAVLTGRVRQSLRTLRLVEQRPLELMRLLNEALFDAPDAARRSQFTTLLLGTLDAVPGGGVAVRIAGGGHPSPLRVDADGAVTSVAVGGMPVGALAAARFAEVDLRLGPGELLLAYTDGVVEARGGPDGQEMFGEERLRAALASAAGLAPAALVDRLLELVDGWLDGQHQDDIAMLAVAAAPA
ncbi:PP2C family protein-serine/threonine phosphatase [Micromonospora sp. CPCC 205546]|uniref:PP2C family protein-serine/threonine phosphatase n=1 Tax=Micromonospora sp. CPCC 205546 TaxID=3122397 RepID=UPI002FF2C70A